MTVFNCLFEPKKTAIKDGAVRLAISIKAPNKKVAESIVVGKLWEHYPANGDGYFKPKVWQDAPGQDRSEIGVFDEKFAEAHDFDGEKWVDRVMPESNGDHSGGAELIDVMTLSPRERFAAVLLFSATEVDDATLSQVVDYLDNMDNTDLNDDEEGDRLNRFIISSMEAHDPIKEMDASGLNNLIQKIFAHFENQRPGRAAIYQFIKSCDAESETSTSTSTSTSAEINSAAATASSQTVEPRAYAHTYATLDQEVALALLPVNANEKVLTSTLRAAEDVIKQEREDFKRWSIALRTTEKILQYDRPSIFGVIQNVPAKDTHHFPDSLRKHIVAWLEKNGRFESGEEQPEAKVKSIGGGHFSIDGLVNNPASNEVKKTEVVASAPVSETQAQQAKEQLNDMGYGVYATSEEPEQPLSERVKGLVTQCDELVKRVNAEENQQQVVSDIEKSLSERPEEEQENLALWKRVFRTDERFTKAFAVNGGGTSINGTYMTMLATREFGPKGIGWGVDILEERFDTGAPILRKFKGQDGNQAWEVIPNGTGGILTELHHVIKVKLWYLQDGERGEEIAFGCTPYLYDSKYGPVCDGEATKKSLTDATKKALSALGFSADIFMGLYDNPEYRQQNKAEFDIKNASESAEDAARLRQELDEKLTRVANTLASGISEHELSKVFASIAREVEVHRKDAEAKGDKQHANYLSKRLRRLTEIKDGRIAELNKAQEKTA